MYIVIGFKYNIVYQCACPSLPEQAKQLRVICALFKLYPLHLYSVQYIYTSIIKSEHTVLSSFKVEQLNTSNQLPLISVAKSIDTTPSVV